MDKLEYKDMVVDLRSLVDGIWIDYGSLAYAYIAGLAAMEFFPKGLAFGIPILIYLAILLARVRKRLP